MPRAWRNWRAGAALRIPGRQDLAQYAYGRNAVYRRADHGNALLSKFPIIGFTNHDVSQPGDEKRGLLHCVLAARRRQPVVHAICVHLGLRESHRRHQLDRLLALLGTRGAAECAR